MLSHKMGDIWPVRGTFWTIFQVSTACCYIKRLHQSDGIKKKESACLDWWRNSGTVFLCSTCKYALDWYIWPLCHVSVLCHCLAHERHISETPVKFKVAPVFFNLHCTGSSRMTYVTFNANRTACSFLVEWGKKSNLRCMYECFYAVENRGKFSEMKHTVKTKDKNGNF